jgi:hypothetical protein
METLEDKIMPKLCPRFYCEKCHYATSKKSSFDNHILSDKHKRITQNYKIDYNYAENMPKLCSETNNGVTCVCGKKYKHRQGLWKHRKTCEYLDHNTCENNYGTNNTGDKELIMMLVKQNTELMEILKNGTMNNSHNTTTTHTNSHNKAFNLNFFLNETCKNAMNITDFVDSIKLQLSDFIEVGELGYVEGISKIIVKNLNALDETVRPIHCTDKKRETFYIKDENKWEKEEEDMIKIKKMIKKIAYKNERLMSSYKEKYPDYNDPDSKNSDKYSKTVIEALGGIGNDDIEKENKIIRHISRATSIKNK